jgi:hypothetical protein
MLFSIFDSLLTFLLAFKKATRVNTALSNSITNNKDSILLAWGAGGRKFEPSHPDLKMKAL